MTPHSVSASAAYSEQVGVNLHEGVPLSGDRYRWYNRIRYTKGRENIISLLP